MLTLTLRTEYHERLTCSTHLHDLGEAIDVLNAQYVEFVRTRQAATHSYDGYDTPISRLRTRVAEALGKVEPADGAAGHVLELVAIDELVARASGSRPTRTRRATRSPTATTARRSASGGRDGGAAARGGTP